MFRKISPQESGTDGGAWYEEIVQAVEEFYREAGEGLRAYALRVQKRKDAIHVGVVAKHTRHRL